MNLVWHMAKKDLRRMALPVAVWIVLLVAPTVALVVVEPPVEGHVGSALDGWRTIWLGWTQLLLGVQLLIGCVLAGALVIEDPLVGSTAFWMTRPIGNRRLFAAKLLGAALLFVAAPVIALVPVWLACGFGTREVCFSAGEFAARFGPMALFALTVASAVRTLPQFLLCSIVVLAAFTATAVIPEPLWQNASMAVRRARYALVSAGLVPVLALIAAHQFFTRRVARTWTFVVIALLAAGLIRSAWPWDLPSPSGRRNIERSAGGRGSEVVAEPTFSKPAGLNRAMPGLLGTTSWSADGFHAPVFARSSDGNVAMRSSGRWESEAGLRTLGFKTTAEPLRWQLTMTGRPPENVPEDELHLTGTLEIWSVRTRIIGEMPVQIGAEIADGGQRTRIIALGWNEDRLDDIFLEDRESQSSALAGWSSNWSQRATESVRHIDRYFLVNRVAGKVQPAAVWDLGTMGMNSVLIRHRRVGVTWPRSSGEGVLIKLRFESDQRFERPLEVRGTATRRPPPTPRP